MVHVHPRIKHFPDQLMCQMKDSRFYAVMFGMWIVAFDHLSVCHNYTSNNNKKTILLDLLSIL